MQIDKLRLTGFKSFVEPTDLLIARGLTGVVGPNGCGKSNLLEALRWVMGESSYKSMRASAMDDVIFAGTAGRPARSMAEVTITIDNAKRTAPAEFNDSDVIEVTRRIERESGSSYHINGREARARDVKILFEDAATGARSPALVRQGQIGEIVNAKPEQRRRVLEDAAGIAGLHSRRHEAELRLKAAENNLARLGDVIEQLKSQREGLRRQARQARRYSDLSDQIRQAEAVVLLLAWQQAQADVGAEETALQAALAALGVVTQQEAGAIRLEAELAAKLQPLREQEKIRAAVVTRKRHEFDRLEGEKQRLGERRQELEAQAVRLDQDEAREANLARDAVERSELLTREVQELAAGQQADSGEEEKLAAALEAASRSLGETEAREAAVHKALSERQSEERSLRALGDERKARHFRLTEEVARLSREATAIEATLPDRAEIDAARAARDAAASELETFEGQLGASQAAVETARGALRQAQEAREAARLDLKSLETERATLAQMLQTEAQAFAPVLDEIDVETGFEVALAAALGDDIEAALDAEAPVYWGGQGGAATGDDAVLPAGAVPLLQHVRAPAALHRRLGQIGLVDAAAGWRLQAQLEAGQRLVSRDGALWRWDGFVAKAEAPSAAAQRLAGRNRLGEVTTQLDAARQRAEDTEATAQANAQALGTAEEAARRCGGQIRAAGQCLKELDTQVGRLDQRLGEVTAKLERIFEARTAAERDAAALAALIAESDQLIGELQPIGTLESDLAAVREAARGERDRVAGLKASLHGLARERERITARLAQIDQEVERLKIRRSETEARQRDIAGRKETLGKALAEIRERPAQIEVQLETMRSEIEVAERERQAAADTLAGVETQRTAEQANLRTLGGQVAEAREARARADARLEAARQKRSDVMKAIDEQMETTPDGLVEMTGLDGTRLPRPDEADAKLMRLKAERERLGGVNLQAERELDDIEKRYEELDRERSDVDEAIQKLRAGIASLNREGKKRLKQAFTIVDDHFQTLFRTLFNGGEARLEMIESDEDPLAGGLEIIARPPGKKPATLSLLSGGEQTLTALSLIFAVFLTNPSPICVLDEVDAPLDDANVDRFCRMMEKMAGDTDTRFLCITHHPETMARMDRLFGVTMAEKGVSQLVSVDLQRAERFLEAGE